MNDAGFDAGTGVEVKHFSRDPAHVEIYQGIEYTIHWILKTQLEVVLPTSDFQRAADAIITAIGDKAKNDDVIYGVPMATAINIGDGKAMKFKKS